MHVVPTQVLSELHLPDLTRGWREGRSAGAGATVSHNSGILPGLPASRADVVSKGPLPLRARWLGQQIPPAAVHLPGLPLPFAAELPAQPPAQSHLPPACRPPLHAPPPAGRQVRGRQSVDIPSCGSRGALSAASAAIIALPPGPSCASLQPSLPLQAGSAGVGPRRGCALPPEPSWGGGRGGGRRARRSADALSPPTSSTWPSRGGHLVQQEPAQRTKAKSVKRGGHLVQQEEGVILRDVRDALKLALRLPLADELVCGVPEGAGRGRAAQGGRGMARRGRAPAQGTGPGDAVWRGPLPGNSSTTNARSAFRFGPSSASCL